MMVGPLSFFEAMQGTFSETFAATGRMYRKLSRDCLFTCQTKIAVNNSKTSDQIGMIPTKPSQPPKYPVNTVPNPSILWQITLLKSWDPQLFKINSRWPISNVIQDFSYLAFLLFQLRKSLAFPPTKNGRENESPAEGLIELEAVVSAVDEGLGRHLLLGQVSGDKNPVPTGVVVLDHHP